MSRPLLLSLIALGACSAPLEPEGRRILGEVVTADAFPGAESPEITVLPGGKLRVRVLTMHGCRVIRTDTEIVRKDRVVILFPYEYRKICHERPIITAVHETTLSFDQPGQLLVQVVGRTGEGEHQTFTETVEIE